jgi:hypothetical protein
MSTKVGWAVVLLAVLVIGQTSVASQIIPPGGPYNPAGLMAQESEKCTGDRFTFALFGDSYANPVLRTLLEMVDTCSPTFIVTLGDMVEAGAGKEAPPNWRMLSERAGWLFRSRPTWPVIGNHETDESFDEGVNNFLSFYGLHDTNYSFTFRNAKFIVLGMDRDERFVPPDQLAFLRQELADRSSYQHVFVFRHVPFYTIGMKDKEEVPNQETEIVKLFNDNHVTAVFAGHDHYYYRTRRAGVTHIIAGVSGAGVYDLRRLAEQAPGDAYMGASAAEDQVILHVPGRVDKYAPYKEYYETGNQWLFAVLVHVNGSRVTAETISMDGDVWDSFVLAGDDFVAAKACAGSAAR